MPLTPGTKLGQYEVVEAIGAGGMGEVYRARDTKLGRDVAIKVLPEEFARDKERLDRFEREARLLAQLNHANIATLHGLEEHDGQKFLVMELVEGETLAERIAQGPIPIDEAIPLFIQIAEGLEAAHEKGIIHRDLKPANIKIGPDGKPKVLDFGLAKAFTDNDDASRDMSQSPTLTKDTAIGAIMGTASYMSPEQAKGKPVNKRTDNFAFACVLYESLTGRKAFDGENATETLGAIIHKEPDWAALPGNTPSNVRGVLKRCFEKDARRRTRDIGDVALELADAAHETSPPAEQRRGVRLLAFVAFVLLLMLVAYLAGSYRSTPSTAVTEWNGEKLGGPTVSVFPNISPDDTLLAFLVVDRGLTQVAVMQPGGAGSSRQLTHDRTRGYAGLPAWSADSSRIYFDRTSPDASNIFSVSSVGDAEERLVLEDATGPHPLPDGSLLVVKNNEERLPQLFRFRPGTNSLESLPVLLVRSLLDQAIEVVPGGREAVVLGRPEGAAASETHLHVVDLDNGAIRRIAPDVELPPLNWEFPLCATEDEAYFQLPAGDLHQIVAVSLDESPGVRSMLSLTLPALAVDIARDGTLYLDQMDQPTEILRIDPETMDVERFPVSTDFQSVVPLPGDRFLLASMASRQDRLMVLAPPAAPVPFLVDADEEARGPLALVGDDSVAFLIGPASDQQLGVASIDGRLQGRIPIQNEGAVTGLASSLDGTSLYYAADGAVHRVPSAGGDSIEMWPGSEMAVDPSTEDLVILRRGAVGQLVRIPAAGGAETALELTGDWRIFGAGFGNLTGHAFAPDGRLTIRTLPPASWLLPAGILDGRSGGQVTPFLDPPDTDMISAGWDRAGRVVTLSKPFQSELWRFRPRANQTTQP